jgi:hypothetical protein
VTALALCIAVAPTVATAQVTTFTSFATWTAALAGGPSGLDTFNDLPAGAIGSPIDRSAGAFTYRASVVASPDSPDFFPAGSDADRWLSTDSPLASMQFDAFSTGTNAIGGAFFGSNLAGAFLTSDIVVSWVTTAGSGSTTLAAPSVSSFFGLVTAGTLTSLTVSSVQVDGQEFRWGTVNDLRVGRATVIPEPSTYALLATGLVALALVRRRRA